MRHKEGIIRRVKGKYVCLKEQSVRNQLNIRMLASLNLFLCELTLSKLSPFSSLFCSHTHSAQDSFHFWICIQRWAPGGPGGPYGMGKSEPWLVPSQGTHPTLCIITLALCLFFVHHFFHVDKNNYIPQLDMVLLRSDAYHYKLWVIGKTCIVSALLISISETNYILVGIFI